LLLRGFAVTPDVFVPDDGKTISTSGTRPEFCIPAHVRDSASATLGAYFEKINGVDRVVLGNDHVNPERYLKNIEILNAHLPLKGKKLLEIGSGYGISLALMLQRFGVDAIGVEPASHGFEESFQCARVILEANQLDPMRIVDAAGENLPFDDASFDVVYSNNVLEHTAKPEQVLREAARVLKPGGTLYIEVPNYLSYYEGHYLIPQPPIIWRGLLASWVKWVYRRDPSFARTLRTEINPIWLRKNLREVAQEYPLEVLTLGEERFLARLARPFVFQTDAVRGVARGTIKLLQALNYKNWIGHLIVKLNGHYPIILIATRSSDALRGGDSGRQAKAPSRA
jgi:ubiquinone/menaquinone biosynthesis C-methylase UbiE